jgi:hypothetical protein
MADACLAMTGRKLLHDRWGSNDEGNDGGSAAAAASAAAAGGSYIVKDGFCRLALCSL